MVAAVACPVYDSVLEFSQEMLGMAVHAHLIMTQTRWQGWGHIVPDDDQILPSAALGQRKFIVPSSIGNAQLAAAA